MKNRVNMRKALRAEERRLSELRASLEVQRDRLPPGQDRADIAAAAQCLNEAVTTIGRAQRWVDGSVRR